MGLILEKVHSVQTFDQSPWLAPYIRKNTRKRRKATNPFDSSIAKLTVK